MLHLHLQHRTKGVARRSRGEATRSRRPNPAKMPTTCGERGNGRVSRAHVREQNSTLILEVKMRLRY